VGEGRALNTNFGITRKKGKTSITHVAEIVRFSLNKKILCLLSPPAFLSSTPHFLVTDFSKKRS
jgi:hypothetical protein